jgi:1,4-alpha-glucan branching enzyme
MPLTGNPLTEGLLRDQSFLAGHRYPAKTSATSQTPGGIIAEESTACGGVSAPADAGSLGFGFKWMVGCTITLELMALDPIHRHWRCDKLTFGLLYA